MAVNAGVCDPSCIAQTEPNKSMQMVSLYSPVCSISYLVLSAPLPGTRGGRIGKHWCNLCGFKLTHSCVDSLGSFRGFAVKKKNVKHTLCYGTKLCVGLDNGKQEASAKKIKIPG